MPRFPTGDFFDTETAGAVRLAAATAGALVWANSPWPESYSSLWQTSVALDLDLRPWVNDGLMALFFLVVSMEVKREVLQGELRGRRQAALPVVAALGGMVVPALLYLLVNGAGGSGRGWGIPMATDIAFALAVLALVAPAIPSSVRVFLLALAIVDDIGAIVVIAVVYSAGIEGWWLAASVGLVAAIWALRRAGVRAPPVVVLLGLLLWFTVHASGVHATIAGVALGLLLPAGSVLEDHLHRWTSFVIVPVFALANAGVRLGGDALADAATSPVTAGVVVGLVAGKLVGITGASWLAVRTGLAELPEGAPWRQLAGVAALGGIGFTVSLFIAGLAFTTEAPADEAKVGILAASLLATAAGALLLRPPPVWSK